MDEKALVATVAEQAGLAKEETADLIRATLEDLGSQLSGGEVRELAVDLPDGLASNLPAHGGHAHPVRLSEFIGQLSRRTGLNEEDVTRGVRRTLTVLSRSSGGTHLQHALSQLPAEYRRLIATSA